MGNVAEYSVNIWITENATPLASSVVEHLRSLLPPAMAQHAARYKRWEDSQAYLLGRYLLAEGLRAYGITPVLADIALTAFGRPYLPGIPIDFNISHSGAFVAVAFSTHGSIGIDIEQMLPVDMDDFSAQLTADERHFIRQSADPLTEFFRFWTIKEAAIKADGRGMSLPLRDVVVHDDSVTIYDKRWKVHRIDVSPGYHAHLVAEVSGTVKVWNGSSLF